MSIISRPIQERKYYQIFSYLEFFEKISSKCKVKVNLMMKTILRNSTKVVQKVMRMLVQYERKALKVVTLHNGG